jgi:hypothetical protein
MRGPVSSYSEPATADRVWGISKVPGRDRGHTLPAVAGFYRPFFSRQKNLVFGAMSKVIRRRRTEIEYGLVLEYWRVGILG